MTEMHVNEELIASLKAEREAARKIAHRTIADRRTADATLSRAEKARTEAIEASKVAWDRLRSITAALNTLGARDSAGRTLYDAEPES